MRGAVLGWLPASCPPLVMSDFDPDRLLLMGRCGRAHGIQGDVKVFPETDDPSRFEALGRVFVGTSAKKAQPWTVKRVRYQPQKGRVIVLLLLDGVPGRDEAEALGGLMVYAHEDDLPPLDEGEVFLHDLIGLDVVLLDPDGERVSEPIGTVRDVLDGGAQPLFVIDRDGQPDVLVPDVPEIVIDVDLDQGCLIIDPPEGLLD